MTLLADLKDAYLGIHWRDCDQGAKGHLDRFVAFAAASFSPAEHVAQEALGSPAPTPEQIEAIRAEVRAEIQAEMTAEVERAIAASGDKVQATAAEHLTAPVPLPIPGAAMPVVAASV